MTTGLLGYTLDVLQRLSEFGFGGIVYWAVFKAKQTLCLSRGHDSWR